MKRLIGPLAILLIAALASHWATLAYTPGYIMDRTLAKLKERGIAEHAFTTPQRITPQTQVVVRSSPDLFYSLCRYDVSNPGSVLKVTMSEWPDYQSLSFFDAKTNNFATFRGRGQQVNVSLVATGPTDGSASFFKPGPNDLVAPTGRGVVLIRRLAPTQELFEQAKEAAQSDSCDIFYS